MPRLIFASAAFALLMMISCNQPAQKNDYILQDNAIVIESATNNPPNIAEEKNEQRLNTESYDNITENIFLKTDREPVSTFSVDVDDAAYSNVRRFLHSGNMPPAGAVRIEELINYFDYDYDAPKENIPFNVVTETAECPWNKKHKLVHIGIKGRETPKEKRPASNIVFLVDVSGSMDEPNKLPLLKQSLRMLTRQLRKDDRVAIVTYAGAAGLVLPSTPGSDQQSIFAALDHLSAGGATAGAEGIELAYATARKHFITGGNNRVILATDGDFNVGAASEDELVRLIEKEKKDNIFLTVLGFGMGNYQDSKMQQLADKGNGNHAYIDNINEARKILVNEFGSTLFTIAKDVKLQIEFNPVHVQSYRLIGYENRLLRQQDFNDDKKDAGDIGSGHTVTALYEIIPVGVKDSFSVKTDALKYQVSAKTQLSFNDEMMNIKIRYKTPEGDLSKLIVKAIPAGSVDLLASSENFRFAAAVASFGMLLRNSGFKQGSSYDMVLALATSALGKDDFGYRSEFLQLVLTAKELAYASEQTALTSSR